MHGALEWTEEMLFFVLTLAAMAAFAPAEFGAALLGIPAEPRIETVTAAGRRAAIVAACDRTHGQFGLFVSADPRDRPFEDGWQAVAVYDPVWWSIRGVRKPATRRWPRLAGSDTVWSMPNGRTVAVDLARAAGSDGLVLDLLLPGDAAEERARAVRLDADFLRQASRLACEC